MNVLRLLRKLRERTARWFSAMSRLRLRSWRGLPVSIVDLKRWLKMDLGELNRQLQGALHKSWAQEWSTSGQIRNIAQWSPMIRGMVLGAAFLFVFGCTAFVLWAEPLQRLDGQAHEANVLKIRYVRLAEQSKMLPDYEQQVAQIEAQFGDMLEMIPASLESVQVLQQISRAARESGLRLQWFKPAPEIPEDAYVILPVDIRLAGSYHAVGRFLDAVSRMKHLITVDVMLEALDTAPGQLVLATRIKAYRGDGARLPLAQQARRGESDAAR